MFNFNTELAFLYAVFLFSLLSIFLTFWIVWHTERKLDIAFKFFLLGIIVFTVGILFEIFQFYNVIAAWQWEKIFKAFFIIFFTVGLFEMRDLILSMEKDRQQRQVQVMPAPKKARKQESKKARKQ